MITIMYKKNCCCPICNSNNALNDSYYEDSIGLVEQHVFCPDCGYTLHMFYSNPLEWFDDITKSITFTDGTTVKNNIERHKAIRSKIRDIEHIPVDPDWGRYV